MQMYARFLHRPDFGLMLKNRRRTIGSSLSVESVRGLGTRDPSPAGGRRTEETNHVDVSPNNALLTLMENLRVTNIKNSIVRKRSQDEPGSLAVSYIPFSDLMIRFRGWGAGGGGSGENCQLASELGYRSFPPIC